MTEKKNDARMVSQTAKSEEHTGKTVLNGTQDNANPVNRGQVYGMDAVKAYYAKVSAIFPQSSVTLEEFVKFPTENGIAVSDEVEVN